ncbi:MAG: tRNA-dihydrouridine synthase family protein [Bacteroidales bacterium]|nr:tRNA-dihydrouridine synthase family protein [Bacteroidales bacterium]
MSQEILLAPIQGVTDSIFRNTFQKYFGGVDYLYSPYLRLDKDMQLKNSKIKDVLKENNEGVNLIPQIMTNNSEGFIFLSKFLSEQGYDHINWNLGCPFPMVTNKQLGSGLLPYPERINEILEESLSKNSVKVSIKMRLGLEDDMEIFKILPILNKYPISEIIIHPRTGKQMYKGHINTDIFGECLSLTDHKICYNGDINNLDRYDLLKTRFNSVDSWMLGRGLVSNPFLAAQIKGEEIQENKIEVFKKFHNELVQQYLNKLSGPSHLLSKMRVYWEYFALSFSNSHKVYKRVKKATSIEKYNIAVEQNCNQESWIA